MRKSDLKKLASFWLVPSGGRGRRTETGIQLRVLRAKDKYYVTGRMKRFIKIFGLRINLDEVQKMIENHFGISAACKG